MDTVRFERTTLTSPDTAAWLASLLQCQLPCWADWSTRQSSTALRWIVGCECYTIELRALGYLMGRWWIMRWLWAKSEGESNEYDGIGRGHRCSE